MADFDTNFLDDVQGEVSDDELEGIFATPRQNSLLSNTGIPDWDPNHLYENRTTLGAFIESARHYKKQFMQKHFLKRT